MDTNNIVSKSQMSYHPIILESPYAGDLDLNKQYLRACMRDCLLKGEAPFASHGLYTQEGVLRDDVPEERQHGIEAGFAWRALTRFTVVYCDLGVSGGMQKGIEHARSIGHLIEYRMLGEEWKTPVKHDDYIIVSSLIGLMVGMTLFGPVGGALGMALGILCGWRDRKHDE